MDGPVQRRNKGLVSTLLENLELTIVALTLVIITEEISNSLFWKFNCPIKITGYSLPKNTLNYLFH